jgi:hypothetical protein
MPADHVPGQLSLGLERHVAGDLRPLVPPRSRHQAFGR